MTDTAELLRLTHAELLAAAQAQAQRIAALERGLRNAWDSRDAERRRRRRALVWAWSYRCKLATAIQSLDVAYGWLTTASAERDSVRDLHRSDLKAARVEIEAHFAARMQTERERDLLASETARLRAALDEATESIVNLLVDQHADACGACDDAESRLGPEDVRELDRARQKRRRAAQRGERGAGAMSKGGIPGGHPRPCDCCAPDLVAIRARWTGYAEEDMRPIQVEVLALLDLADAQAERLARATEHHDDTLVVLKMAEEELVSLRAQHHEVLRTYGSHLERCTLDRGTPCSCGFDGYLFGAEGEVTPVRPDPDGTIEIEFRTADLPNSRPTILLEAPDA